MSRFVSYLKLVRLPAVFTAMADIVLGYVLVQPSLLTVPAGFAESPLGKLVPESWASESPLLFGLLLVSSCGLYLAGMTFNDYFDREIDARERANRPIPAGHISASAAWRLGATLMMIGLLFSALAGMLSLVIALILAACILGYDGGLKNRSFGPLVMGSCRTMNVLLGASAANRPEDLASVGVWPVAVALGVYIAGVTWFSRQEAEWSSRGRLLLATLVADLGILGLVLSVQLAPVAGRSTRVSLALFIIGFILNRRLLLAIGNPSPQRVQSAVKLMLMTLVVLDALLVFHQTGNVVLAGAVAALVVPSLLVGRLLYVT